MEEDGDGGVRAVLTPARRPRIAPGADLCPGRTCGRGKCALAGLTRPGGPLVVVPAGARVVTRVDADGASVRAAGSLRLAASERRRGGVRSRIILPKHSPDDDLRPEELEGPQPSAVAEGLLRALGTALVRREPIRDERGPRAGAAVAAAPPEDCGSPPEACCCGAPVRAEGAPPTKSTP